MKVLGLLPRRDLLPELSTENRKPTPIGKFRSSRLCRPQILRPPYAQPDGSEASARLPKTQPEELAASTVEGETLTEVGTPGGEGTLAIPLSGVVLPEGLELKEQRKRLWFAAVKPPMYTVALIPVLVSFGNFHGYLTCSVSRVHTKLCYAQTALYLRALLRQLRSAAPWLTQLQGISLPAIFGRSILLPSISLRG